MAVYIVFDSTRRNTTRKRLILIHGRSFKPAKAELEAIWTEALRYGISRDFGDAKVGQFEHVDKELAYYGDFSNDFLLKEGVTYDPQKDLDDRRTALEELKRWNSPDVAGETGKSNYQKVNGQSSMWGPFADFADLLPLAALSDRIISRKLPDIEQYWNVDEKFGSDVR